MKVHYINILLFGFPLNILAHNEYILHTTPNHTQTNRSLCECELYAPANYDNDQEMKAVMEKFNKQTEDRFHEYDERMKTTRQKCREQCDKEIQKIILKDKLEKELMDKFATLQTDIQNDAIPTCVCEKSIADKVEKGCLRCGSVLSGGVAPSVGLLGGLGTYGWKPLALEAAKAAAIAAAEAAGKAAGLKEGTNRVIIGLETLGVDKFCPEIFNSIGTSTNYYDVTKIANAIFKKYEASCPVYSPGQANGAICEDFIENFGLLNPDTLNLIGDPSTEITNTIKSLVGGIKEVADNKAAEATLSETPVLQARYTAAVETTYGSCQTAIIASVVAIVVIILIMVIIYKILRYRRKKKMKKKLQYIKLLEE
ncbi:rifin PIR protein, putative [Plasmodium reichenowi]|uniref:Rifin PIR protein, putative n=1 Tax=Plasmodium reichenowi TaxID=5854 RepID=A0A2P9DSV5_PLARE|nr:rifin PIR protein, putative [Plasmodium reichenowi]